MTKRILATLLCVCLLLPFTGMAAGQVFAGETGGNYIIRSIGLKFSETVTLSGQDVFAIKELAITPLDLQTDYDFDLDRLAIQFDAYISGDLMFINYINNNLSGQLEITSSGTCDVQEFRIGANTAFNFERDKWVRRVIPFSEFYDAGGFNPAAINYIRIYLQEYAEGIYKGTSGTFKLCNFAIVDLHQQAPSEEELPLGDGTFQADPPVFQEMEVGAGYNDGTPVFAGYNLKTYIQEHPEVNIYDINGNKDYSGAINSLMDGLSAAGGGALFIPAGEWECRSELVVPDGTSIVGEWINPDEVSTACGTILKVYAGANVIAGAPFITMFKHTLVENVSFWYPEQDVMNPVSYPPTIDLNQYATVRNVTLYNSYSGIRSTDIIACPNTWNIYGTPLETGIDIDMILDIARIENIHFSEDYWVNSRLPGAPTTDEQKEALRSQLYNYATGITVGRIDWSYCALFDIRGYNIGVKFKQSSRGEYPQGQFSFGTLTNCKYGHFVAGVSSYAAIMFDITMKDCEYGVYLNGSTSTALSYYDSDIKATGYAVYQSNSQLQFNMTNSIIRGGRVYTENGNNIFINNKFHTKAPHIELDYGTVSAILLGNTDAYGDGIEYWNPGECPVDYDKKKMDIDPYKGVTTEEILAPIVGPNGSASEVPYDIDNTGATDVTEKIQTYLTSLASQGGGTLFLQPGKYRIEGTLEIPTGVELRGSGDFATIPKALNTILQIYTPVEAGKDAYTSTATVTLQEDSGLRGVIFNYPDQGKDYEYVETVQGVECYKFNWKPYPYTVRGAGADVYLKYVTVRNGWNGVDFKTNRCDNHFIDYMAGHFFNRGIVVGGGSTGGLLRNFQFNGNAITAPRGAYAGWEGMPQTDNEINIFNGPFYSQQANYLTTLELGHVEDQIVYNCFVYGTGYGLHLVGEDSGAADARIHGFGVDYGRVPVCVEEAEYVEITNIQLTSMNHGNSSTDRWYVNQEENPLYTYWIKDTFDGEISVYNHTEFAAYGALPPTAAVRVDSGTLNMYNYFAVHEKTPMFEVNGDGVLNMVAFSYRGQNNIPHPFAGESKKNIHLTAGYVWGAVADLEQVGSYKYVYEHKTRYSVPQNVTFTDDSELVFTESFDGMEANEFTSASALQVDTVENVSIRRNAVRLRLDSNNIQQGLKAGQNKDQSKPFILTGGEKNSLYRMEWRFNIGQMRDTEDSEINIYLTNADASSQKVVVIKKDGTLYQQDGTEIGTVELDTDYRLALEIDARDVNNKTVTLFLLDDDSRVIAKGTAITLADKFQGENTVTGFYFAALASPGEAPATYTDLTVDYVYIVRSETSTIGRNDAMMGDVNGDGEINSTDARLVLQYSVEKIDETALSLDTADVNGDDKINSTDARLILQYAVEKIDEFPAA